MPEPEVSLRLVGAGGRCEVSCLIGSIHETSE